MLGFHPVHLNWAPQGGSRGVPLIEDDGRRLSRDEFRRAVAGLAGLLSGRGIGRGDVVAAILPNRLEIVVTMFAAWQVGAAFMPVNPALTGDEAGYQLEDSGARIVVVGEATAGIVAGAAAEPVLAGSWAEGMPGPPASPPPAQTALLIYTSGTTGRPKGVMLSHRNIDAMVRSIHAALRIDGARSLLVMPLFHVNALLVSVLAPLAAGGTVRIMAQFDRRTFWDSVRASGAAYFSGVPAMYILLTDEPGPVLPAPKLRFAVCGAAPMPATAIGAFEARYGVPILEGYGLTESTVGATLNPLDGPRRPGSVGRPLPGVAIRIVDDEGRPRAPGTVGEVAIRGDNVMQGYLGRPEESAVAIVDGWLRTGDLGTCDEDGWLTLVGRKKDLIIRGGENIYPTEVEHALVATGAVLEAAVVGRADSVMGEVPVAFVVPVGGGVAADVEAVLRDRLAATLAPFKRPVAYHVVDALPRNPVGKIDKSALRARVGG